MIMKVLRTVIATLLLSVVLLVGASGGVVHAAEDDDQCNPGVPIDGIQIDDPCGKPKPPPGGGPEADPPPAEDDDGGKSDDDKADDGYVRYGTDADPLDAPGQWGKASGQGAQGLADYAAEKIQKRLDEHWSFSAGWLGLYSIMVALGIVLAVAAIMVASARLASSTVEGRTVFAKGILRLLLLLPVCLAIPVVVQLGSNTGWGLAEGFLVMGWQEVKDQLDWIVGLFGVGTLGTWLLPGGPAIVIAAAGMIIAAILGILVELAAAEFLQYALALLLPIVIGASVNPRWAGGLRKVVAALVGAMLAPAAMAFIFTVVWSTVVPSDVDRLWRIVIFAVGVFVSLIAPYAAAMLLQYVLSSFGAWRGAGAEAGFARAVNDGVRNANRSRSGFQNRITGQMDRMKAAQGTTDATAARSGGGEPAAAAAQGAGAVGGRAGAAGAAGGAGGAAAAAGPVGLAVMAASATQQKVQQGVDAVRSRVQGAFARQGDSSKSDAQQTPPTGIGRQGSTPFVPGSGAADASRPPGGRDRGGPLPAAAGRPAGAAAASSAGGRVSSSADDDQDGSAGLRADADAERSAGVDSADARSAVDIDGDAPELADDDAGHVEAADSSTSREVGEGDWTDDGQPVHAAAAESDDPGDSGSVIGGDEAALRGEVRDADSSPPPQPEPGAGAGGPAPAGEPQHADRPEPVRPAPQRGPTFADTGARFNRQADDVPPNREPVSYPTNTRNTGSAGGHVSVSGSAPGTRGSSGRGSEGGGMPTPPDTPPRREPPVTADPGETSRGRNWWSEHHRPNGGERR